MPSKKINITLQEDQIMRIDEYAKRNHLSRSGLIAMATEQYLVAVEAMPNVNKLLENLAATTTGVLSGELTPMEAKIRMDNIEATYSDLFKGKK